ncbi:hypothetical protein GCM10009597_48870 [Peribacillus frigoritolerans]
MDTNPNNTGAKHIPKMIKADLILCEDNHVPRNINPTIEKTTLGNDIVSKVITGNTKSMPIVRFPIISPNSVCSTLLVILLNLGIFVLLDLLLRVALSDIVNVIMSLGQVH